MSADKGEIKRMFKFLFFSCGAGIIQIGSFTVLNELTPSPYWLSYLISLTLSVLFNFTLNKKYTFKSADNVPKCMLLVAAFYLFFAPLSTLAEHHFTAFANEYIVTALIMLSNLILEFLYTRFFVYRKTIDTN